MYEAKLIKSSILPYVGLTMLIITTIIFEGVRSMLLEVHSFIRT